MTFHVKTPRVSPETHPLDQGKDSAEFLIGTFEPPSAILNEVGRQPSIVGRPRQNLYAGNPTIGSSLIGDR